VIDTVAEHRDEAIRPRLEAVGRAAAAAELSGAAGILAQREMLEADRITVLRHLDRHEIRHALRRHAVHQAVAALIAAIAAGIREHRNIIAPGARVASRRPS
jgi:hypothetical protein